MNYLYRIIDANINRAAEGLRVIEDIARFGLKNIQFTEQLKQLRHQIRGQAVVFSEEFAERLVAARDSVNDVGLPISQKNKIDARNSLDDVVASNFKRTQEALRVIEEVFKLVGMYDSGKLYETYRYQTYQLETIWLGKKNELEISHKADKIRTDIYGITDYAHSRGRDTVEVVKLMIDAGIKVIQYREKDKDLSMKYQECCQIRELTRNAGVTFIVNDHIDIAMLVQADGVHIGQDDLPIEEVRRLAGRNFLVGVSTHSPQQALDAVRRGADYIGVGPLFLTQTKRNVCAPVGLSYLKYIVKNVSIPFVAIGGIKEDNLEEVIACGAHCVSLVTDIVGAENISEKVKNLRKIILKVRK